MGESVSFECLKGKIITEIERSPENALVDRLIFSTNDGEEYRMYHDQDCCESVYLEDVAGDLADLLDTPILLAEEVSNINNANGAEETWTFYKLSTINGTVTLRWYGSSNGYYSTDVSFHRM